MRSVLRILCLCLLLISASAGAQSLYKNKFTGPYILLYKLTPQQVEFLALNPQKIDSQFLYTKLVGKVSSDSVFPIRSLPYDEYPIKPFTDRIKYQKYVQRYNIWDIKENGYFLEVSVTSLYKVSYRIIENPLFYSAVHKIGYETFVFIEDTAGLPVYNAKVHLDTAFCPLDSSVGGYKIRGNNIRGIMKIERGDLFTISILKGYKDKTNNSAPPKDKFNYAKIRYQGYLVTNKPKYKPWDTLFFKSFLVNAKGKPLKKTMIARIYQNSNVYAKELILKPKNKGAYDGYFIINDSFLVDQPLYITLLNKSRAQVKTQEVRLENYELRDIFFAAKTDKDLVTPGGGIKIYVTANTANRLPIMDGKLSLKMSLINVNFTDADSVVIPFSKYENWYTVKVQTDPSGVTIFELPDSVFIPLDGTYRIHCSLLTADNETREAYVQFNYQTTRDRQVAELVKDTLSIIRLYNMKSVVRTMRIKIFSRKDQIADSLVKTPLKLYLPPNVYMAQIYSGDTLTGTFYRQTLLPEIKGKRSHDSIQIAFKSAFDIPVFYRIYANNKLVKSGKATELNWKQKDKSKSSYHMQFGILDGSVIAPRFYSQSFYLAEKELKVEIIQPDIVYPGQEVAIEIRVKDAYNKPVNKVNLAAWAVNTQLDDIVTPDVPYLGLVKMQKPLPLRQWPLQTVIPTYTSFVKGWQLDQFFLYKNDAFKLAYPQGGFNVITDTTPRNTTEIDFYAHGQFARNTITYVKINDTLFYSSIITPKPGVLRIKPGVYNMSIRTFGHLFNFKNVEIKAGKKNFVCLQLDSLNQLYPNDTLSPGFLTTKELEMYRNHTLVFRYDHLLLDTFIIKSNGKVAGGFKVGYEMQNLIKKVVVSTKLYNPGKSIKDQVSRQEFFIMGPYMEGSELELYWKKGYSHIFNFRPGTAYGFTAKEMVTESLPDWTKEIRYIQNVNTENYQWNTFWWDPEFVDTIKRKPVTPVYYPPNREQPYRGNLKEFQYQNFISVKNPRVGNSQMHLYLTNNYIPRRIWLFDRNDSNYSVMENYNGFNTTYPAIGLIAKRHLWTYAAKKSQQQFRLIIELNDSTWLVKNIDMDSSVHLFLNLKSSEFRKLSRKEYTLYDRLAKMLTRAPLSSFTDTPTVNKGLFIIPQRQKDGRTHIEGTVIGPGIKYPVENAFVVLERNGIFVRGAITNREGRFVMENVDPGKYMLKIKGNQYHYWLHYDLQINGGYNHIVQAEMRPLAGYSYTTMTYDNRSNAYLSSGANSYSYNAPMSDERSYSMELNTVTLSSKDIMRLPQRGVAALASVSSGVNKKMESISFLGSRTDGTRIFIDGVPTIGGADNGYMDDIVESEEESAAPISTEGWTEEEKKAEEERLKKLSTDLNARKTRKEFKDYAYWIPNLYTNKQGKAVFSVRYPDNVTSWQTFVPAMDGKRHSGLGQLTVKSYKPIVVSLALPQFLTEGDSLMAYGRLMNYTGRNQQGNYQLKYGQETLNKQIDIKDYYTDSLKVIASKPGDTLQVQASFEMSGGYRDAELRKIPINPATVISGKSMFEEIKSDTTLKFTADIKDIGMDITVYNHQLALVLEMIKEVEELEAFDNRSIAAYLNALLIKKSVCKTLKVPFKQEKNIRESMSKLKKAQNDVGLFSWFKGGKHAFIVSTYVAEVMYKAHKMGYENNTWLNAARAMENRIKLTGGTERLEFLLCLKNMQRTVDYGTLIKEINLVELDQSQKLSYWRLMQLLGNTIPIHQINSIMETTYEGNLRIAGTWDWRYAPITDDAANTYTAWQILFEANASLERRKALVEYLATECNSPANSRIKAVEAMLKEALRDSSFSSEFKPVVEVDGKSIAADKLPASYHLKPGETLELKHSGAPVYVAANRKYRTYEPTVDASQFGIVMSVPNFTDYKVNAGTPFTMKVTVFAKRNQYNAVIDIPIPAGCVYGSKIQGETGVETYRAYQPERVLIFCDELTFGYHTFTINLNPRFTGTFYTAPARSALMFYPDKAAFTKKQRWMVRK
jgi:hypothetical protein